MNYRYLFLVLILFVSSQSFSQSYKPKWGKTSKIEGGSLRSSFDPMGIVGDHYYIYNSPKKGSDQLIKYSFDHKVVSDVALDLKYDGTALYLNQLIKTSKGTFAYLSDVADKKKEWAFYTSSFNDGDFGPVQEKFSFKSAEPNAFEDKLLKTINLSKDKSKVAFVRTIASKDKKSQIELFIALFDAEMNVLWTKNQTIPYSNKSTYLKQVIVGNDGIVYLSMRHKNSKIKRAKDVVKYDCKIFTITEANMQEIKVELEEDLVPTSIALFANDNPEKGFRVAGLYMPNLKKSLMTGIFTATGDKKSSSISNVKVHHFDKEDEKSVFGDKAENVKFSLNLENDINNLFTFSDGSFGFVTEKSFFRIPYSPNGTKAGSLNEFVTHSLTIPVFSKDGQFITLSRIAKGYGSVTQEYCSYTMANYNDKLYFVFNAGVTKKELKAYLKKHSKSKSKGKSKDKKSGYRPVFTDMAIINKTGELEFDKNIFTNQTVGKEFMPRLCDFENGRFLLGAGNMGKYRFGLINLQEKTTVK